ncbi:gliding motility-associated C-terminal domain-containing protein [Oscillatoria amoena NRMC-F 0135]|nr:gliding motility-associated C-terminal domain-containing protein [Oscillatoria amoena NRMC-F 0135]
MDNTHSYDKLPAFAGVVRQKLATKFSLVKNLPTAGRHQPRVRRAKQPCQVNDTVIKKLNGHNILIVLWTAGFILSTFFCFAQDGENDPSFNPSDIGSPFGADERVVASAIQADGKIVIGGLFTAYNGITANRITRLNTNGTIDIGFDTGSGANGLIWDVKIQTDGKILIVGEFTSYNGVTRNRIARLNTDGSLDLGFNPGAGFDDQVIEAVIQPDGKIILCGSFSTFNWITRSGLVRLNSNGTIDTTFDPGTSANNSVYTIDLQSDGKIIIGGLFTSYNGISINRIARIDANGTFDSSFNPGSGADDQVRRIKIQSDGRIIIGGRFVNYDGSARNRIARLNSNGTIDVSFNPGTGFNDQVESIALQSDGRIVVGGVINTFNGISRNGVVRLNIDGSLDTSFDPGVGTNNTVDICALQTDGKVIIGGGFTSFNGSVRNHIARLNSNGSNDSGFNAGSGTGADNIVRAIAVQPDGKILIGGEFTFYNSIGRNRVARINADGNLDNSFNIGTGANGAIRAIKIQPDGKTIIGGDFFTYNGSNVSRIARLNPDGTVDVSFNPGTGANNTIWSIAFQSDGKIIIGGDFTLYNGIARNRVARLNSDGSLDVGFNPGTGANGSVFTNSVLVDGKVIVSGSFNSFSGTSRNFIARLNNDGSLDTGFNPGTGANDWIRSNTIQPDGKIIIVGDFTSYNGTAINRVARLNTNGSLDNSFVTGSGAQSNPVLICALQVDGRVIIAGDFTSYNGIARNRIARVNSDGSLDTTFDPGIGVNNFIRMISIQFDGKILIGGAFTSYNGIIRTRIARVMGTPINPIPIVSNQQVCSNSSALLTASGATGSQEYRWYNVPTGGTSLATSPTFTTPTLLTTTSYYVSFFDPIGGIESMRSEIVVTVLPLPNAPGITPVNPVCPGSTVTLTASGTTDGNYRWYEDGTPLTGEVNAFLTVVNVTGSRTIQAAIFDGTCESNRTGIAITIKNCTPPVIAPVTTTAFIEGTVTINLCDLISDAENDLDASSIQALSTLTSSAPFSISGCTLTINYAGVPFPGTDRLTIQACDQTGLCTEQEVSIELGGEITIYNALSPNGDGKNDNFYIQYIDVLPEAQQNRVTIYNRWGDVVWSASDYNNTTVVFKGVGTNDKELPTGTYFYKLEFTGGKPRTGFISLKR